MTRRTGPRDVTVTLPPWTASRLENAVRKGLYANLEEAVLTGARLVAGLGPRAQELLAEGAVADGLVRAEDPGEKGQWL